MGVSSLAEWNACPIHNKEPTLNEWRDSFSPCPVSAVLVDRQVLAEALKKNRTLQRLNLANTRIGVQGAQAQRSEWRVLVEGSGRRSCLAIARFGSLTIRVVKVFSFSSIDQNDVVLCFSCYSCQFMCSCVASPQGVVAWFAEAFHCRLRAVELTAWVSYLLRSK